MPDAPRTDPGVRHNRTGLLPRVMTRRHRAVHAVRSRAPVTGSTRRCVRPLACWTTFPLARSLPSTSSTGPSGQPLFEGFCGTLKRSDSLHPCVTVVPRGYTVRTWPCRARPDAEPLEPYNLRVLAYSCGNKAWQSQQEHGTTAGGEGCIRVDRKSKSTAGRMLPSRTFLGENGREPWEVTYCWH